MKHNSIEDNFTFNKKQIWHIDKNMFYLFAIIFSNIMVVLEYYIYQ